MSCEVKNRAFHGVILGRTLSVRSISTSTCKASDSPPGDCSPAASTDIHKEQLLLIREHITCITCRQYLRVAAGVTVCIDADKTRAVSHLGLHSLVGNITSHEAFPLTHTQSATSFIRAPKNSVLFSTSLADNVHIISF